MLPLEVAPLARRDGPEVRSAADRSRSIVLEDYAPASVVVDARGEIRYYWGTNLGFYLPTRAGPPATNLMHLVRKELKVELGGTLQNAARQGGPVTHTDLAVTVDGETTIVYRFCRTDGSALASAADPAAVGAVRAAGLVLRSRESGVGGRAAVSSKQ